MCANIKQYHIISSKRAFSILSACFVWGPQRGREAIELVNVVRILTKGVREGIVEASSTQQNGDDDDDVINR